MVFLSWQARMAIILSIIWLVFIAAISRNESNSFAVFLLLGILPVAFCCGVIWVWSGFRKQRPTKPLSPLEAPIDEPVLNSTIYPWIIAVLLSSGIGLFYYAFEKTGVDPVDKIAYFVGYYFWVALLVYWLWHSKFKRKKGVGLLLFAVAFLGIAFYQSHAMLRDAEDTQKAISKVQTMILKLMNGELVEKSEILNLGQYSSMLLVLHDFLSSVMNDLKELKTKIDKSGFETIFNPATLENAEAITNVTASLKSIIESIEKTEKKIILRYTEFPRTIDLADIPEKLKGSFRGGAERGIRKGKAEFSEYFKLLHTLFDTSIQMLEFMMQRQGQFEIQEDSILFSSQADIDKYNEYLQIIQTLALKELEIENAQLLSSTKLMEQMQKIR